MCLIHYKEQAQKSLLFRNQTTTIAFPKNAHAKIAIGARWPGKNAIAKPVGSPDPNSRH